MEPIELPHVWLSKLGAQVLTPTGMVGTCTLGKPTMLDYVVHSIELNGLLLLRPDLYGTTRPHASLVLGIHRRPRTMLATQLAVPAEFPFQKKRDASGDAGDELAAGSEVATEREVVPPRLPFRKSESRKQKFRKPILRKGVGYED